jgi:aspartate racemase
VARRVTGTARDTARLPITRGGHEGRRLDGGRTAVANLPTTRRDGPTLGVLGGLGPAAGVEFLRLFTEAWPATRDQDHPRVILLSEPAIPDRTAARRGTGPDPTPHLNEALERLALWGADLLAVPCNTAFAFIDEFPVVLPVPIMHTVAVTLDAAQVCAPTGAWLLATDGCLTSGVYQRYADERGYSVREPRPGAARRVHECIEMAKAGRLADATRLFDEVLDGLPDAWPPLLACTELSLIRPLSRHRRPSVDSTQVLAAEAVRRLRLCGHRGAMGDELPEIPGGTAAGAGRGGWSPSRHR